MILRFLKFNTMPTILDQWFDEEATTCNISPIHVINTLQKMGAPRSRVKAVKSRSDTCHLISEALSMTCLKNWRFSSYLGSGTHGVIFSVVNKGGSTRAAKIVTMDPKSEIKTQKALSKIGIAPKVYHSCKLSDNVWAIVMEKIDGSLGDLVGGHRKLSSRMLSRVFEEIVRNIELLEKKNISHGDLSLENIGYVVLPDGGIRLMLIDFGWSGPYVPMFDMVSLAQALLFTKNRENRDFLYRKVMGYIEDRYHYKLPGAALEVNTLFRDFQDKYIQQMRRSS